MPKPKSKFSVAKSLLSAHLSLFHMLDKAMNPDFIKIGLNRAFNSEESQKP